MYNSTIVRRCEADLGDGWWHKDSLLYTTDKVVYLQKVEKNSIHIHPYPDVWVTRQASNLTFCNWLRLSNNSSLQSPPSNSGHHSTLVPKLQTSTSYLVKRRDDGPSERMFTFGFVWNIAGGWLLDSDYPFSSIGDLFTQWRFLGLSPINVFF